MRVHGAFRNAAACRNAIAFGDNHAGTERDKVRAGLPRLLVCHHHVAVLLNLLKGNHTGDLGNDGKMLRPAALEQFLNAGKTLRDILGARNAAGVERSHGQLRAGLADGLGRDNADGPRRQ